MQLLFCTTKTCVLFAGLAMATAAQAQDAAANSPAQSPSTVPDGHIIYARDVPYGSAIGPRTPGHAQTVNAGPTELILASLAAGLEAIGDDEYAGIAAATNLPAGATGRYVLQGLSALSDLNGSGGSASSLGDIQSTATGGAINRATGAIRGAMGSLRGVLGESLNIGTRGGQ